MCDFDEILKVRTSAQTDILTPWVDKYRPTKLNQIVHQTDAVKIFTKIVKTLNLPHLILYGPAGTGKTSIINAVAQELFGPRLYKDRIMELNASDERGINVVRSKIKTFASIKIGSIDPRYPSPPYKIIILDEADAMTSEAQAALRKTIENKSNITRFCFICNYINQIIDPITSRCVKIRFRPINEQFMTEKLRNISSLENITINTEAIKLISNMANGDMRKGIMILQNLKYLGKNIDENDIYNISNSIPKHITLNIIDNCINLPNLESLIDHITSINASGYSVYNLLMDINKEIIHSDKFNDKQKALICIEFANIEKILIDGGDEYLQLLNICTIIRSNYMRKLMI